RTGTYVCTAGARACNGSVAKSSEVCDAVDNDCNGLTDDVAGIGTACSGGGTNTAGECTAAYRCNGMSGPGPNGLTCTQQTGPMPEVCNGIDDNCNGQVDENVPGVGGPCGGACPGGLVANCVGECKAGTLQCLNGAPVCSGSSGPSPEICDGKDNDCNGRTDDALTDPWLGAACCPTGNAAHCT